MAIVTTAYGDEVFTSLDDSSFLCTALLLLCEPRADLEERETQESNSENCDDDGFPLHCIPRFLFLVWLIVRPKLPPLIGWRQSDSLPPTQLNKDAHRYWALIKLFPFRRIPLHLIPLQNSTNHIVHLESFLPEKLARPLTSMA